MSWRGVSLGRHRIPKLRMSDGSVGVFRLRRQHQGRCCPGRIGQSLTPGAEGLRRRCKLHGIVQSVNFPAKRSGRRSPISDANLMAGWLVHPSTIAAPSSAQHPFASIVQWTGASIVQWTGHPEVPVARSSTWPIYDTATADDTVMWVTTRIRAI